MAKLDHGLFDPLLDRCPLCSSPKIRWYNRDLRARSVYRCVRCRTQFLNPQYSDNYLAEYYSQYVGSPCADDELESPRARRKLAILQQVQRSVSRGRLLSIGSGNGLELLVAKRAGWEVQGYDVDEETTRVISARTGVPVLSGNFLGLELPAAHYQCVMMDQVLEHVKNPRDYLAAVHRVLAPDGILLLGCPNIESLANAAKTCLDRLGFRRHRGGHYGIPKHLVYFSPFAMKRALEQTFGFTVLTVEGDPLSDEHAAEPGSLLSRTVQDCRRRFPVLDSTFVILAQKAADSSSSLPAERTAA